jgi:ribosomal-protein-alanine N-acetyltransferase
MVSADFPAVAAIEKGAFSPWSHASIGEELQRDDATALVLCRGLVVVAWGCCRHNDFEAELLKISVSSSLRRRGLGSMLLETFFDICRQRSVSELFLEVRALNHAARSFYQSHGFTDVGRRISYYRQPPDDALVLKKIMNHHKKVQEHEKYS